MTGKHTTEKRVILAIPVAIALLLACSKVPQQEVDAARQALQRARDAGAADYAPQALQQAEDAVAQLDAELQAQEKKFSLTRRYDKTGELAANARSAAEKAAEDAATGKEQARVEADSLIRQARTAMEQARTELASAPAGKGTQADIQALKSDLAEVEQSIGEAERAFQEGRFHDSLVKAQAAKSNAERIQSEVESARAAKRQT